MSVRLVSLIVTSLNMLSIITFAWHASALHIINQYIFESVKKKNEKKELVAVSLKFLYDLVQTVKKNDRQRISNEHKYLPGEPKGV